MNEHGVAPADGYCPACGALENEACCLPNGTPRIDHKSRHPYPPAAVPAPEARS